MMVVFVFILGLLLGSFLNVVVYRLRRGESFIKGFSKCLFCGHRLHHSDLVPLFSYIFLRGRCRYCGQSFSPQYFLVELATALAFTLVFLDLFPGTDFLTAAPYLWWQMLLWWAITFFLIVIFVYDLKYYLILDQVIWPATVIALLASWLAGLSWWQVLWGALVGLSFFLIQFVLSRGRWIGGGDIRLGLLMGLILGWPQILTALFIAYVSGSLISLLLLALRRKGWQDKIPFGTFLSLATFLVMLYGQEMIDWYLNLLSLSQF